MKPRLLLFLPPLLFYACSNGSQPIPPSPTNDAIVQQTRVPTLENPSSTSLPAEPTHIWTATPDTRPDPAVWRNWPVVPRVSARAIEIYRQGIERGNDPHSFSKIGDCQSEPAVFLGIFDTNDRYVLKGDDQRLSGVIEQFRGSFARESAAVANGLSVASMFSPTWATNEACIGSETPLDCEFRLNNPSIVIISLGTNWKPGSEIAYEEHFRQIIEYAVSRGVLPIIATKADNVEGDNKLNDIMAQLAYEYDLPLWNFWQATYHLPGHGIDPIHEGGILYLTTEAWDIKSFTGLRALDAVWQAVSNGQPSE
jgi:hypothetical protein